MREQKTLESLGIKAGNRMLSTTSPSLDFGIETLRRLSVTIPRGSLTEWGVPSGRHGRRLLIAMLAHAAPLTLWIHNRQDKVYPPSWAACGVDLERLYFAHAVQPVSELRPVFLESIFQAIVIDKPTKLSKEDCAFLAKQARSQQQAILILRDFFLTPRLGNPHAKVRANIWRDHRDHRFHLAPLRGHKPQSIIVDDLDASELRHE